LHRKRLAVKSQAPGYQLPLMDQSILCQLTVSTLRKRMN